MDKMWAGRFTKPSDKLADDFNSSLPFDCRMYVQDIRGSIAHATMLGEQGIISKADADAIIEDGRAELVAVVCGRDYKKGEKFKEKYNIESNI